MSKGVLIFAHNNSEIDYLRMAIVNALLVKKHLGVKVCVVTDTHSYNYNLKELGYDVIDKAIDDIRIIDKDRDFKNSNSKVYRDTSSTEKSLSFYNIDRADAYDLSPYDETILIDADYLIMSDTLNKCWDSIHSLMMNYSWQDVNSQRKFELDRLADTSVTMYWATVVYFRKEPYAEYFFELCKHIRQNINYFRGLYRWHGGIYRNDYVFSMAAHQIGGLRDRGVDELPFKLYKTFDYDDVYKAVSDSEIILYLEKHDAPGEFLLSRWSNLDLHVMNKWALNRISSDMMEYLS